MTPDEAIHKRYWLLHNLDWLMDECAYHKENKYNYSNKISPIWTFDAPEGKIEVK